MPGAAVSDARSTSPAVLATGLLDRAEEARLRGDYRSGAELAREASVLAGSAGDAVGLARALKSLGNQLLRLGDHEAAVTACRQAIAALETLGDDVALCETLTVEALALNDLGMHEEALESLGRGREIAQRLGDRDLLYWVHNRTGVVHSSMGSHDLSNEYLMRALTMSADMDDEARFCILNNVGDNAVHLVPQLLAKGDAGAAAAMLSDALGYVTEALALARDAAHPFREAICLDNLGMLRALDGDLEEAGRRIDRSRALAAEHGYRSLESAALQHLARVRLMGGDCAKAIDGLRDALARAAEAGETPMVLEIRRELSEAYERVGDFAAALAEYKAYHELERAAHNDVAAARARMAVHQFELDNARLEAELARMRSDELEVSNATWQRQATEDPLTGLPNRRHAEVRLPEMLASAPLCVAIADVDHFKAVNDRYGHFAGDEVLKRIAAVLRDSVRDTDLVARLGGEEFLLGLGTTDLAEAAARCEDLRARVAAYPWNDLEEGLSVTVSFGVAAAASAAGLPAAMVTADERLYEAKRLGRNRVEAD